MKDTTNMWNTNRLATLVAGSTLTVTAVTPGAVAIAQDAAIPPVATTATGAPVVVTSASPWKGSPLRHPNGGRFYPSVERWGNMVLSVMAELNIPRRYLPGILAQMQQESAGRPKAINRWDSNAAAGTPSKGLLQVIAPTYRAYAKKGYRNVRFQTLPFTNVYAALNYAMDRYGPSKFRQWNRGINPGY